jgi:RimJ/RimL family protein N-acetyltransferase
MTEADRIIRTPRLRGEPLRLDDFDLLRQLESDMEVQRWIFGIIRTPEETRERVARFVASWESDGFGLWVFREGGGEFVGTCGLYSGRLPDFAGLEVGYMLRPQFWGRGLATEMTTGVMRFAFDILRTPAIGAMLVPENVASMRVLEKCGLHRESDFLYLGTTATFFAVSREDWLRANAQ